MRNGIIIAMTTINGKKKLEKEKEKINENLFFHLEEELIESDEDIQRLKEILENENFDDSTKVNIKKASEFYEKFKQNNFSISLEVLARDYKP